MTSLLFRRITRLFLACFAMAAAPAMLPAQTAGAYVTTNLISDGSVPATTMDPLFLNPWGMSVSPNWWISANGSGLNFVVPPSLSIAFKVVVPNAATGTVPGQPTGAVTTAGATGMVLPNGTKASFLFSTLDGTISGWNGKLGTAGAISQIVVNNAAANAVYTGLAALNTGSASYLLVPNFGAGSKVEVYDNTFKPATLAGSFTDPTLPAGYSPYSIHVLGTQIFVAYAVRTSAAPYNEVLAPGNGLVDVYDTNGQFVARAVTGGNLNAPWGVALAPATFGPFANDLLIGNFGDGKINVFDPKTYAYLGQLTDGTGNTLVYLSLWDLLPGGTPNSSGSKSGGTVGTVYFTAGLAGEAHGLLAGIANDSTTAGTATFAASSSSATFAVTAGSSVQTTVALAPIYNFNGSVSLACPGAPNGVTCTFSPAQLSLNGTMPATTTVTIQTQKGNVAGLAEPSSGRMVWAVLLPVAMLVGLRRRRLLMGRPKLFASVVLLTLAAGLMSACSSAGITYLQGTPAGAQIVNVVATSGGISRQVPITLTVK